MPRKNKQIDGRRHREDLRKLDKTSKAYWDEVLRRERLLMSKGLNTHRLVYVGDSAALDEIAGRQHSVSKGPGKAPD